MIQRYLLLLILLGVSFPGPQGPFFGLNTQDVSLLLAYLCLAFLVFGLAHWKTRSGVLTQITPLTVALSLFLLWSALGFFYSIRPDESLMTVIDAWGALFFVLGLILYLKNSNQIREAYQVLLCCACGHGLISLVLHFQDTQSGSPWSSVFLNSNYYADYLLFPLAIAFFFFQKNASQRQRLFARASFVLLFLNLWFTGSRAALGLCLLTVTLGTVYFCYRKQFRHAAFLASGLIVSTVLFFGMNALSSGHPGTPTSSPEATYLVNKGLHFENTATQRWDFWKGALIIFKEHGLLGTGPWTFATAYQKVDSTWDPYHAHNIFLQTAADTGVIGLFLLLSIVYFIYRPFALAFKNQNVRQPSLSTFTLLGITLFGLHNQVEYCLSPAIFLYSFCLWIVCLDFLYRRGSGFQGSLSSPQPAVWTLFLFVALTLGSFFVVQSYRYYQAINDFIQTVSANSPNDRYLQKAKTLCPTCLLPYTVSIDLDIFRYKKTLDPEYKHRALEELDTARSRHAWFPEEYYYRGQISQAEKSWQQAKHYFERARDNAPKLKHRANQNLREIETLIRINAKRSR